MDYRAEMIAQIAIQAMQHIADMPEPKQPVWISAQPENLSTRKRLNHFGNSGSMFNDVGIPRRIKG